MTAYVASERRGHSFAAAGIGNVQFQTAPDDGSAAIAANASLARTGSLVTNSKFANGAVTSAMAFSFGQIARARADRSNELQDRTFRSEKSALRFIQRNVEQPEGLEDGGFIHEVGKRFRVSRIIGGPQSVDLGPPPDDAVAAWHRHPDLGPGSEYFSFATSVTPNGPGPYYHDRQGDVAYSFRHQARFYLLAPGDSLRVINPADIAAVSNPHAQNLSESFRLRWKVQQ